MLCQRFSILSDFSSPHESYDSAQNFSNIVILWLDWLATGRPDVHRFPHQTFNSYADSADFCHLRLGIIYLLRHNKTVASRHLAC